jgi:hypothetical protein
VPVFLKPRSVVHSVLLIQYWASFCQAPLPLADTAISDFSPDFLVSGICYIICTAALLPVSYHHCLCPTLHTDAYQTAPISPLQPLTSPASSMLRAVVVPVTKTLPPGKSFHESSCPIPPCQLPTLDHLRVHRLRPDRKLVHCANIDLTLHITFNITRLQPRWTPPN